MSGYYDFKTSNGLITGAWVDEIKGMNMTLECECCGKTLNNWLSVIYIDECDNEVEAIFGKTCFKKISSKSKIIEL